MYLLNRSVRPDTLGFLVQNETGESRYTRRVRCIVAGIAVASALLAQSPSPPPPEAQDLLEALARTAGLFARTAPLLGARETLEQRARRGDMQVLRRGRNHELKEIAFQIPEFFDTHEVVSDYTMGSAGTSGGFHEIRRTLEIDKVAPAPGSQPRHALTLGVDAENDAKKRRLESLELERLEGAATDFGPLLLLFTEARQRDTKFSAGGRGSVAGENGWVLRYRQTAGAASVTEFRNSREVKHMPEGQVWFRERDLLPLRITLNTEEMLTPKYILRNEAEVEYRPTPFGLAPQLVTHRQYLNDELLVENRFRYSDYRGLEIQP